MIRAILAPVGELARAIEIEPTGAAYKSVLGCDLLDGRECGDFRFWVDDDGVGKGLPANRRIGPHTLYGPVLVVGPTDGADNETGLRPKVEARLLVELNMRAPHPEDVMGPDVLPIYTVYFDTKDYPGRYVVRLFATDKPTTWARSAETLDEVRALIPPGLVRLLRHPDDEPTIVEVWL